jgi:hypothetical protein
MGIVEIRTLTASSCYLARDHAKKLLLSLITAVTDTRTRTPKKRYHHHPALSKKSPACAAVSKMLDDFIHNLPHY